MNGDAHRDESRQTAMPAGLRVLWGEACEWVGWLFHLFDRDALRGHGLSREYGARASIWLMHIEGAVRRLILAAALVFTPPGVRRNASCAAARTPAASPRRRGFRVIRLASGEAVRGPATPVERKCAPKPYGHIPFPADPLLSLGVTQTRPAPPHAARQRNPLDRWGRLSRRDPDWRAPEETPSAAPRDTHRQPPRARHIGQAREAGPDGLDASLHDWRRRHDEWRRVIPAPDLAARLEALQRIADNPAAAIASTARRLARARDRAMMLAQAAAPLAEPPGRAAHITTAGHTLAFAQRCRDALVTPDTS